MEIKKAVIGRLSKPISTGIISGGKVLCRLYWDVVEEKICIIDNGVAIDINDFNNKYIMLKRNENGRIEDEVNDVDLYCLNILPVKEDNKRKCFYKEETIDKEYKKYVKQYKKSLKHK